jgi:AcrR family transcriptional regulator
MSQTAPLTAQQRRTRKAIVDAAARLLDAGGTPSIAEVATEAEVARRTVYLYFATVEQLLVDAALGRLSEEGVELALAEGEGLADVEERVAATVRVVQGYSVETEHLGRTIMRLARPPEGDRAGLPPRGYRRVGWIERALEPARERLAPADFEELVSALTLLVGWEAIIVLRDVRGLSPADCIEVSVRTARALVREALAVAPR